MNTATGQIFISNKRNAVAKKGLKMEAITPMQTVRADEIIASAENERALQHESNGKYIQKTRSVAYPPAIRRRVLYRFFLLYRHLLGLLAGSHLAHVNSLAADKR